MSLITQCPACTTLFKVVPDQLRVSDGWVRCGQCDEVFDANAHLQTTLQEARQSSFGEVTPKSSFIQREPQSATTFTAQAPARAEVVEAAPHAQALAPESVEVASPEAVLPCASEDVRDAWGVAQSQGDDEVQPSGVALIEAALQEQEQEYPVGAEPVLSFMQSAGESLPQPSRPVVRAMLWLGCAALCLLLVVQVLVRERDWIAAKVPVSAPVLTGVCEVVGCQVAALREIESVVIDSSSFVKVRTDVYRIHFTLKNNAFTEVATPALELTLTNTHDQPIVRRVFLPAEFGGRMQVMTAGGELVAALPISVKLPGDAERISGYRLLAFYP